MHVDGVSAVLSPGKNLSYILYCDVAWHFLLKCVIILLKNIATTPDVSCILYQRLYVNRNRNQFKHQALGEETLA